MVLLLRDGHGLLWAGDRAGPLALDAGGRGQEGVGGGQHCCRGAGEGANHAGGGEKGVAFWLWLKRWDVRDRTRLMF